MLYVKFQGDHLLGILNERQLREELKHVSLPKIITDESINFLGYALLPPKPINPDLKETFELQHNVTAVKEDGTWKRMLNLVSVPVPDRERRKLNKEKNIRAKRDILLAQSDWTQLKDITPEMSSLWEEYRQKLRDITDQPEYPFFVIWPLTPKS